MDSIRITDLPEFVSRVEIGNMFYQLVLFRGQGIRGNLTPGIARANVGKNFLRTEAEMISQIRLMGASYIDAVGVNDLDFLVYAQHYGLKTRLLDWTTNPLVALWFACSGSSAEDVYVYELIADDFQEMDIYRRDPFSNKRTAAFQPRLNNSRIVAQHGYFTLHNYTEDRGFVPLEKNGALSGKLTEIVIPGERRHMILAGLDLLGINQRTLFPDFDGLCKYINDKFRSKLF